MKIIFFNYKKSKEPQKKFIKYNFENNSLIKIRINYFSLLFSFYNYSLYLTLFSHLNQSFYSNLLLVSQSQIANYYNTLLIKHLF